ncbi:MAG: PAS domain S-box protein, partial [Methylococcaceae bacterium]|nr:PAS domain S-box protein [Methylococcaceae bacterium]
MKSLREALRRLRESEAMYRNVFDNAGDIIFTVDQDTILTSLNPAFAKVSGWPEGEWTGKSFVPLVSRSDLPMADRVLQGVLQGQAIEPFVLHVLKACGEYFVGELSVTPIKQDGGVILLGICRDVTERKKMEEALRESEQRFRAIFDTAPDGIFTVSAEGKFTSSNPAVAQLVGWSFEDLAGKPYALWIHPEDLPRANQVFLDILAGQPGKVELRVRSKAGGYPFIEVSATPRYEQGSLAGALGFFRDISERKQMEEMVRNLNEALELKIQERTRQLLQAQEELIRKEKLAVLGQVVGSVGHELRNPLGVMNNAVYYLQAVLADADPTTREYLDIIREEIAGADRIVADLLDSVRTKPPQTQTVSIANLIEQTLIKLTIPAAVELRRDIPESIPPLRVDPMQMQQVFRNLICNAIDAMPEGGILEIRAFENPVVKTLSVSVRDTGVGVAEQDLPKLFQPLFTTKARGIGLGLVVVKNLTVANGGSVEVQSEPGQGALFTITLPCDHSTEKMA